MQKSSNFIHLNIILITILCFTMAFAIVFGMEIFGKANLVVTAEEVVHTITYKDSVTQANMQADVLNGNPTTYVDSQKPLKIKAPLSKTGYDFKTWTIAGNIIELSYNETEGTYTIPEEFNGNLTLYANFTPIKYNINYHGIPQGVTAPTIANYTIEDEIILQNITRFGYSFEGWYSSIDYTSLVTKIEKGSTGEVNLYAKFIEKNVNVKFDGALYEDKIVQEGTMAYGENGILKDYTPKKDGYLFDGWYTTINHAPTSFIGIDYTFTEDVTLYAKWTKTANPIWILFIIIFSAVTVLGYLVWLIFGRPKRID